MTFSKNDAWSFYLKAGALSFFLVGAGYILNAALRLHTPLLWVRIAACLVLAALFCVETARNRYLLTALGCVLYLTSFFTDYRIARVTAYVQDNWLAG